VPLSMTKWVASKDRSYQKIDDAGLWRGPADVPGVVKERLLRIKSGTM
jgi:hypothetical protein